MAELKSFIQHAPLMTDENEERNLPKNRRNNTIGNEHLLKIDPPAQVPVRQEPQIPKQNRPRNASVRSTKPQKLYGATIDDERTMNAIPIRTNQQPYAVAFGKTTKAPEIIKNIRAPSAQSKSSLTLIKETIDQHSLQLQSQQNEIYKLKEKLEEYDYGSLLNTNAQLWSAIENLKKQYLSSSSESKKVNSNIPVMAQQIKKDEIYVSTFKKEQQLPKDSMAVKKYKARK